MNDIDMEEKAGILVDASSKHNKSHLNIIMVCLRYTVCQNSTSAKVLSDDVPMDVANAFSLMLLPHDNDLVTNKSTFSPFEIKLHQGSKEGGLS